MRRGSFSSVSSPPSASSLFSSSPLPFPFVGSIPGSSARFCEVCWLGQYRAPMDEGTTEFDEHALRCHAVPAARYARLVPQRPLLYEIRGARKCYTVRRPPTACSLLVAAVLCRGEHSFSYVFIPSGRVTRASSALLVLRAGLLSCFFKCAIPALSTRYVCLARVCIRQATPQQGMAS